MATSTSQANAKVTLDSSSFVKGAKEVMDAAEAMAEVVEASFAVAAVALSAFVAGLGLLAYEAKQVAEFGEQMANAGHAANIAAGQFYLFHNAVEKGLSLKTVSNLIGDNAEVLNRSANVFRDVALKLWVVGEKIRGFWLGLMDRLAPVLSRLLDGALAISLVHAGQVFGEAIANSIAVVYQLAKDGKLWSTIKDAFGIAFQYAAERLLWLSGIMYRVLKLSFATAFWEGIVEGGEIVGRYIDDLGQRFADTIANALISAFADFGSVLNDLMDRLDSSLNAVHLMSDTELERRRKERDSSEDYLNNARTVTGSDSSVPKIVDILTQLENIYKSSEFKGSDGLQQNMDAFATVISQALAGYKTDEKNSPPTTFENNTRRQAFGADSLAAIGAGGNVYTGLSVLDVNRQQLDQLKQINARLGVIRSSQTGNGLTPSTQSDSISRTQTGSVISDD